MDIFFSPGEQSTHSPLSFNLSSMASSPQGKRPLKHIAPLNCENNLLRFREQPGSQRLGNSAYKTPFLLSPLRSRNLVQSVRLWSCPVYVHCIHVYVTIRILKAKCCSPRKKKCHLITSLLQWPLSSCPISKVAIVENFDCKHIIMASENKTLPAL